MTMKTLAAVLLFALTIPAAAAPLTVRSEVPISAPEYGVAGEIGRNHVRLVTNGVDYLAVWTDFREAGVPSVYAARLRADGTLIDPLGIRVAYKAHAGPVVWTGSKYLIAYESEPHFDSYVRTMTADGLFGAPIPASHSARWGSMATNGTNVLLVLPAAAMLLDLEGNKLRDVPLAKLSTEYFHTRVAAAGSTYLVAAAMPAVIVQTVTTDGAVGASRALADPTQFTQIDVATDGEKFLVVWPEPLELYAQLIGTDGAPAGPAHLLAPNVTNFPSVEWRDGEYLVLFSERTLYSHYAVRVAADGSAIGTPKQLPQDYSSVTEIAANGRSGIALFGRMQAGVFDDASLAGDGVFRNFVDVAVTARPQRNVRLARLGDGYVAGWSEGGRILLSTGAGTTPVAVEGSAYALIDVVVDRSNIIWVIWQGHTTNWIVLSRFWGDLTPVDPAPISFELPGVSVAPSVAAGDGVIAFAYQVGDVFGYDVATMLLRETGAGIARKDIRLTTADFADYAPVVAFDGTAFVYAWSHAKGELPYEGHFPMPEIELVGARVTPDGGRLDASPVLIANDIGNVVKIDAARGANGVAFAWQADERLMRAALFNGRGVNLPGSALLTLGELESHDGGFLLVRGNAVLPPALTQIEYLVLGADLSLTATGLLPPYQGNSQQVPLDVDVIGGPAPVFAYSKYANEGRYGRVSRVFVRRTGEAPPRRRVVR